VRERSGSRAWLPALSIATRWGIADRGLLAVVGVPAIAVGLASVSWHASLPEHAPPSRRAPLSEHAPPSGRPSKARAFLLAVGIFVTLAAGVLAIARRDGAVPT
jgi:hypothetical protein